MITKKARLARGLQARKRRREHLMRQRIRDGLKRLKAGETVEISAFVHGAVNLVRVRPVARNEIPHGYVLTVHNRRLSVMYAYEKDGCRLDGTHRQWKEILGVYLGLVVAPGKV